MFSKIFSILTIFIAASAISAGTVSGELKKWHPVTINFAGPSAAESDSSPNPFLDYRLQVTFTGPNGQTYHVAGYFDGDGSGGGAGNVWRVKFSPDEGGVWQYVASFRSGSNVAIDLNPSAGTAASFDGESGSFTVAGLDSNAPGVFAMGRLEYIGGHYLKFTDGGYYIKGGADSPENYLAYSGFDNTTTSRFTLHDFISHVADWNAGDPDWGGGKGKGIIGTLNYLAQQHVNSIYVMPMNIGGDGQDCWPFAGSINPAGAAGNDNTHYDISKLYQWGMFFDHAQGKGIAIQMVLNEAERNNKNELDNATLGTERKLYYREMAARFGHLPALQWNMCEEYNLNLPIAPSMIISWANYLKSVDGHGHPVAIHNQGSVDNFTPFLGSSAIDVMSIQLNNADFGATTETWRNNSRNANKKWVVMFDEFDRCGKVDDESHLTSWPQVSGHSYIRKHILWPIYMSGGGGAEYILQDLLDLEDFRQYETMWKYTWYARKFMEENLPFWEMQPSDGLLSGEDTSKGIGQVLAKTGEVYAVYLPRAASTGSLNLSGVAGDFEKRWYNPRTGVFEGSATTVTGGGSVALGSPPNSSTEDWVVVLKKNDGVMGRHLFYNNSVFDGNDVAANAGDEAAIATDKTALRGGDSSFVNYSSYDKGINGVMVDLQDAQPGIGASDFEWTAGNNSLVDDWPPAPAPVNVTLREGEGVDGCDRVTIVWADYAIRKQWLKVRVLANANTGLTREDVFYFGNAVGETGNSTTDAYVDATDEISGRNNPRHFLNPADIENIHDFNRDGKVDASDAIIARNNPTTMQSALRMLSLPPLAIDPVDPPPPADTTQPLISSDVVFEEVGGEVAFEAEHFYAQDHGEVRTWHWTTADGAPDVTPDYDGPHLGRASGGGYIEVLPDTKQVEADPIVFGENFTELMGTVAVAHYKVYFNTPGRYYVWARIFATSSEDNSLHFGIDGTWPNSGKKWQCLVKNSWVWESKQRTNAEPYGEPFKIYLDVATAGEHIISISMREDGAEFDKFYMTTQQLSGIAGEGLEPRIKQ